MAIRPTCNASSEYPEPDPGYSDPAPEQSALVIEANYGTGDGWTVLDDCTRDGAVDDIDAAYVGRGLSALVASNTAPAVRYRAVCDRGDIAHRVYEATGHPCTIQYPAFNDEPAMWTVTIGHDTA